MNLNALRGIKKFANTLAAGPITDPVLRNKFLLPKGLEVSKTSVMPKERRQVDFLNWKMILKRPEKQVESNVVVFETELFATKPEIKQYLEKVYGFNVLKVNTVITMGKIKCRTTHSQRRKHHHSNPRLLQTTRCEESICFLVA